MKKVLIITYYWPPSGGAGVQRWVKFSKYLQNFGYLPIVITVDANDASYPITDYTLDKEINNVNVIRTKTFEPFTIYKKLLGKKEIPFAGFANETKPGNMEMFSRFVRGNFFIPDARKGWNKYVLPVARKLIKEHNIKYLVTTSPPHSTQLIGLKLKKEYKLNWIADLRDPWTDVYYYKLMYHTRFATSIDKRLEKSVLSNADHVVVVSNSIKELFRKKLTGNSGNKIHIIPNGFDEVDFEGIKKRKNSTLTIIYTGTIADNYNLDNFLKAVDKSNLENLTLRFIGKVSEYYKKVIDHLNIKTQTEFIAHVTHQEAINYMVSADLLLLVIPDVPYNSGILTGKLFEYLATGNTIIGIGPITGDASKIINDCAAGKMFDYNDLDSIVEFLKAAYTQWNNVATLSRKNRCNEFSRKYLTSKIVELFKENLTRLNL